MEIQGRKGLTAGGSLVALRSGDFNELVVNDVGLGRYAEAVRREQVFLASVQAGVALTTTLSVTATGMILTNPIGSGKNIILLEAIFALASAPAGVATIGWAAQTFDPVTTGVTHTTPLTVRSAKGLRAVTGVGLADSAATLPNVPVAVRWVPGGPVAASSIVPPFIRDEIAGALVLIPGTSINTFVLTTAITAAISLLWAEVDE